MMPTSPMAVAHAPRHAWTVPRALDHAKEATSKPTETSRNDKAVFGAMRGVAEPSTCGLETNVSIPKLAPETYSATVSPEMIRTGKARNDHGLGRGRDTNSSESPVNKKHKPALARIAAVWGRI